MKIVSIVTAPFIWLLHSTDFLLNVLQIKPTDGKVTEEEIKR
jgi:hypothetical protein